MTTDTTTTKTTAKKPSAEDLLRRLTVETGSGLDACFYELMELSEAMKRERGHEAKWIKSEELVHLAARSYGGDRTVAISRACEYIAGLDKARASDKPTASKAAALPAKPAPAKEIEK